MFKKHQQPKGTNQESNSSFFKPSIQKMSNDEATASREQIQKMEEEEKSVNPLEEEKTANATEEEQEGV